MTDRSSEKWVAIPDIAERFNLKLSQVHRMLEEHALLAARIDGVLRVPEEFLGESEPLREIKGTVILLLDAGFTEPEALHWLITPNEELDDDSPVAALRAGRRAEVRRVAQALGF